jgi:DinB family protein
MSDSTAERTLTDTALNAWKIYLDRTEKLFLSLDDEQLQTQVAPGKNRLIYLFGHLIAAHDAMLWALGLSERLHPELDAVFLKSPDRAVPTLPSRADLHRMWREVHDAVNARFARLTPDEWLQKHALISDEAFAAHPLQNRMSVMITRVTHMASHLGQAYLAYKP